MITLARWVGMPVRAIVVFFPTVIALIVLTLKRDEGFAKAVEETWVEWVWKYEQRLSV